MSDSLATMSVDMSGLRNQVKALAISSPRAMGDIVNQTSLNAIGRAFNETPKAERTRIGAQLGQFVKINRINKKGKIKVSTRLVTVRGSSAPAPLLALILNSRRGKASKLGLYGSAMTKAMGKALKSRLFSAGYEASGWIPGMRDLASKLAKPFYIARLKGVAAVGRPKGSATPAKDSWSPTAEIVNNVKNIDKIGKQALQKGVDAEALEIPRHIEEKMKPHEKAFNDASKK